MEILKTERARFDLPVPVDYQPSRESLVERLRQFCEAKQAGPGFHYLTEYVGALNYLLARSDLNNEAGLDYVVTSNWPFDLVRRLGADLIRDTIKQTELERCLSVLQPSFAILPDELELADHYSRQYCTLSFNVGSNRYMLMFLCPDDVILSQQRLREVGTLASYFVSAIYCQDVQPEREMDLTEREVECLFWISEGKTSDEIATILGISRNTINNYITSVMRKTGTKTRSEAIAFAVRHNLV